MWSCVEWCYVELCGVVNKKIMIFGGVRCGAVWRLAIKMIILMH